MCTPEDWNSKPDISKFYLNMSWLSTVLKQRKRVHKCFQHLKQNKRYSILYLKKYFQFDEWTCWINLTQSLWWIIASLSFPGIQSLIFLNFSCYIGGRLAGCAVLEETRAEWQQWRMAASATSCALAKVRRLPSRHIKIVQTPKHSTIVKYNCRVVMTRTLPRVVIYVCREHF